MKYLMKMKGTVKIKMAKGYFLLIDPQKNTLRIPTDDDFIRDAFRHNSNLTDNIKRHTTKKELELELSNYLKGGGKE